MKIEKLIKFALVVTLLLNVGLFSQVQFRATVKNQTVVLTDPTYGPCIYFDIYLVQNDGPGPLYLADADFKFSFNANNFGTTIEYIDGSNELYNSNGALTSSYNTGISPAFLSPNRLSISIQPPGFTNQTQFNTRVAKIDSIENKHKLGTFVVYNITNTSGTFGLTWLTGVGGTVITSFASTSPWFSSQATGTLDPIDDTPLPVELSSFTAVCEGRNVNLNWQTKSEVNSNSFVIERQIVKNNVGEEWKTIGSVSANGTTTSAHDYSFTDSKLNSGKYNYRLKMIDNDGTFDYSDVIELEVALPQEYAISQNYPNPFNPTTRIDYQLPFDSKVTLELYAITGEKVATLINNELTAGYYTVDIDAGVLNLASGMYIYRMTALNSTGQNFVQVKKLMLTK